MAKRFYATCPEVARMGGDRYVCTDHATSLHSGAVACAGEMPCVEDPFEHRQFTHGDAEKMLFERLDDFYAMAPSDVKTYPGFFRFVTLAINDVSSNFDFTAWDRSGVYKNKLENAVDEMFPDALHTAVATCRGHMELEENKYYLDRNTCVYNQPRCQRQRNHCWVKQRTDQCISASGARIVCQTPKRLVRSMCGDQGTPPCPQLISKRKAPAWFDVV